jgi:hypothetical protein
LWHSRAPGKNERPKHSKHNTNLNLSFTPLYGALGFGYVQVTSFGEVLENGRQRHSAQILGLEFLFGTPTFEKSTFKPRQNAMISIHEYLF